MKVCSLYGAGFYYIPGTDICMKVGGYVRYQVNYANGGFSASNGPTEGAGGRNNRLDSADIIQRTRAVATFDTRQQTGYGTLRTYLLMGFQQDTSAGAPTTSPAVYITRGFIQFAGFTFGKATSQYDFFPRAALAYHAGNIFAPDTGDGGQIGMWYTAQFGGGVSASLGIEHSQRKPTVNVSAGGFAAGGTPNCNDLGAAGGATTNATGTALTGFNCAGSIPDIVGNLRWDGAWGAFQVSGALHDVSAGYYGTNSAGTWEQNGHPGNKWGYAGQVGLRINTPWIGSGDYFVASTSYTVGASTFASSSNSGSKLIWNGGSLAYGFLVDGVYGGATSATGTNVELQTAWSVAAAYEHFWTPALQTSVYGSYIKVTHGTAGTALICGTTAGVAFAATQAFTAGASCNPDWSMYNIGSRTQWNITRGLYVGLDVLYARLNTAMSGTGFYTPTAAQALVMGKQNMAYTVSNQDSWNFAFRVHRDVVP